MALDQSRLQRPDTYVSGLRLWSRKLFVHQPEPRMAADGNRIGQDNFRASELHEGARSGENYIDTARADVARCRAFRIFHKLRRKEGRRVARSPRSISVRVAD